MNAPRRALPRIVVAAARGLGLACALAAALCLLVGGALGQGQYAAVQRQQKLSAVQGGLGPLGNDWRFGVSVADLGDFDGDGVHDIVVGAHRANIGGGERGAVFLLMLNADGTVRQRTEISSVVGGLLGPLDDHDRFGVSAANLGDLDLDGVTDLAVGAYRDDDGGFDVGAVYVLFLNADGTVKAEQKISPTVGGLDVPMDTEDSFGWCVEAVPDLDGDGVMDLFVGASRDDGDSGDVSMDFGGLYLLFLNRDGTVKSHVKYGAGGEGLGLALHPRDRFGADVALLGDPDGDGNLDIAVGAFGEDPLKYGKVFVLHLGAGGNLSSFSQFGFQAGGFTGTLRPGDRFGMSLAVTDADADGLADLFVGAPSDDDGGNAAGAVWLCLMNADGSVRAQEKVSPLTGGFQGPLDANDFFAVALDTIGDVDHDGSVDLVIGAYQDDDGGLDHGAAYVLFRSPNGVPVADFTSAPDAGELPLTTSFADASSGDVTARLWDFGDGTTSTQVAPQHTYTTAGSYAVALTVTGPAGSDTLVRPGAVVVQAPTVPVADFGAVPTLGTAPLTVAFSDLSQGTVDAWTWEFGDGTISYQRDPEHRYDFPGTYSVRLTATGPGGSSSLLSVDLVEVAEPPPVARFVTGPALGLAPLTVQFTDDSTLFVTSWLWDFGDGTTSTEQHPQHVFDAPGLYDVALTVTSAGGSDQVTVPGSVTALAPPVAAASVDVASAVAPFMAAFSDLSTGDVTSWLWDFGDGTTSFEPNPVHGFTDPGTYTVTLEVGDAFARDATTLTVEALWPRPRVRFAADVTSGEVPLRVQFTDLSIGNVTAWEWDFGDGHSGDTPSPAHTYWQEGTYTVRFRVYGPGGFMGTVRQDFITVAPPTSAVPRRPAPPSGPVREIR